MMAPNHQHTTFGVLIENVSCSRGYTSKLLGLLQIMFYMYKWDLCLAHSITNTKNYNRRSHTPGWPNLLLIVHYCFQIYTNEWQHKILHQFFDRENSRSLPYDGEYCYPLGEKGKKQRSKRLFTPSA